MKVERTGQGLIIDLDSEADTERLGRALSEVVEPSMVLGLVGPLGAGKTRLTRAIAEALGVPSGAIASPTFVLIHEYPGRLPVYHFDTYRLSDPDEFDALGASEYFEGDGLCLVEWADRVADRLPNDAWHLRIEPTGPNQRRAVLIGPESARPKLEHVERLLRARP